MTKRVNLFYDDGEDRNPNDAKLYNKPTERTRKSLVDINCTACGKTNKVSTILATSSFICNQCLKNKLRG